METSHSLELKKFLDSKQITQITPHSTISHVRMKPGGKFDISNTTCNDKFWELYHNCYRNKDCDHLLYIAECATEYSPVRLDIDLKFPLENESQISNIRKYTSIDIEYIISVCISCMKKILTLDENCDMTSYVFEKGDNMRITDTCLKDGIHIMFINVITDTKSLKYIYMKLNEELCKDECLSHLKSSLMNNLIDDVSTKPWLILGSKKKDDISRYELTKVYTEELVNIYDNTRKIAPRTFSIRKEYPTAYLQETQYVNDDPIGELVNMLSKDRCDDYDGWIKVGICLKNISTDLKDVFINWSKKSEKFNYDICSKQWDSISR